MIIVPSRGKNGSAESQMRILEPRRQVHFGDAARINSIPQAFEWASNQSVDLRIEGQPQDLLKPRIHVCVLVRNVQDFDRWKIELFEPGGKPLLVLVLHYVNDVRPPKVFFIHSMLRFGPNATRPNFNALVVAVNLRSRGAAIPIHGTHEKDSEASVHSWGSFAASRVWPFATAQSKEPSTFHPSGSQQCCR